MTASKLNVKMIKESTLEMIQPRGILAAVAAAADGGQGER